MRQTPRVAVPLALLVALLGGAACFPEAPTRAVEPPGGAPPALAAALPAAPPDARVRTLLASLFDGGHETAALARWDAVRRRADAGPPHVAVAMLAELLAWMDGKQADVATLTPALCDGARCETVASTAAKARLLMQAYVHGLDAPDLPVGVDFGGALVLPGGGDPPPIVTLNLLAGVDLAPGSVNVPTLVTIVADPTTYPTCAGPLVTTLCQIPRFYRFESSPHVRLAVPAAFAVCHTRPPALPWATTDLDDRLLLAHDLPADPANWTPGGVQFEGIEILPYRQVTFLHCDEHAEVAFAPRAGPLARGGRALLAALGAAFAPRTAWAIDLGGGGESLYFSSFNVVDPAPPTPASGAPDLRVENLTVSPLTVSAGGSVGIHWKVRNAAGFPNGRYVTAVLLSADATLVPGTDVELARGRANAGLGANATADQGQGVVIPAGTPPGIYYLGAFVDPDDRIAESDETNNFLVVQITVVAGGSVVARAGSR